MVLAGGGARRLAGLDKASLEVGGLALLDRVLSAASGAARIVVVGPERDLTGAARRVIRVQEDPPGAGPVAALQAGLAVVGAPVVVLLAADLPFLPGALVTELADTVAASGTAPVTGIGPAGAVVLDDEGQPQWLLSAWPVGVLRQVLAGAAPSASLRSVLGRLAFAEVRPAGWPDPVWYDCDTPEQLEEARRREGTRHDPRPDPRPDPPANAADLGA